PVSFGEIIMDEKPFFMVEVQGVGAVVHGAFRQAGLALVGDLGAEVLGAARLEATEAERSEEKSRPFHV
ncbi:hypothetical protein RZS08_63220, partial [Arthrospira platensis SPKY1]|nr:hypothetical protein [Arthrospira platensis SPKY1]